MKCPVANYWSSDIICYKLENSTHGSPSYWDLGLLRQGITQQNYKK